MMICKKLELLKRILREKIPYIKRNPEKLTDYIEHSYVSITDTSSASFQRSYDVAVGVEDYSGNLDDILLVVNDFLKEQQPQLFHQKNNRAYHVQTARLDNDRLDIVISFELTERVIVSTDQAGNRITEHLLEQTDDDSFGNNAKLWHLKLGDDVQIDAADAP